jgi:hypothetical protein
MRGHQILLKRIITSWLHVDVLLVTRFLIPEYPTYEHGHHAIEVVLLIVVFKLTGSFGLVFERFGEVVGGTLSQMLQYPSPNMILNSKKDSDQLQLSLVPAWLNYGRVLSRKKTPYRVCHYQWTSALFQVWVP